MTALRQARERFERHPLLVVVVPTVLALGAVALLADLAGGERLDRAARNLHPAWLLLCLGGQLLAYAGYVLVVRDTGRVEVSTVGRLTPRSEDSVVGLVTALAH